jgi:hypothetical protein
MRASQAGRGYDIPSPKAVHRNVLFVFNSDGTFNVLEDAPEALRAYRPRREEKTSLHRAFVRRSL